MQLEKIKKYGNVHKVLDIGANIGQFYHEFKTHFPDSYIFSIEATPECEELLRLNNPNYLISGLYKENTELVFYKMKDNLRCTGNSLYRELTDFYNDENLIEENIKVITLDSIFPEKPIFDLIKIDTQGSELDIIEGGKGVYQLSKFILLGVSLIEYNQDQPLIGEVEEYMKNIGFEQVDILGEKFHPTTKELIRYDILYMNKNLKDKNNDVSIVLTYCSGDYRFIDSNIQNCLKITDDVVVSTYDHLFNGQREDLGYVYELMRRYPQVKFVISEWSNFIDHPRYWHNMGRLRGYEKTNKYYDWVIFLDADEFLDPVLFPQMLRQDGIHNYDGYVLAVNWYYREPTYRSKTLEHTIPFYKKSVMYMNPFNFTSERGQVIENSKNVLFNVTFSGKVLVNHYSWVRSKEDILKKVTSWGHKDDMNWVELVEKEYSKDFDGTDFFKGYEYEVVDDIYRLGQFVFI